jgi:signal transduction protein with GAF and PtsI domain
VLEEGTANSHVSIVARALGIPAVGEVPNAPGLADPGDAIIVDGRPAIYTARRPKSNRPMRAGAAAPAAGPLALRDALRDQGRRRSG